MLSRTTSHTTSRAPSHRDRGSVLMLMPAAVLIVLVLSAIAVDLSIVQLGQHQLVDAADAAANDAVTYGLAEASLRDGGGYALDPARVRDAVVRSLDAEGLLDQLSAPPDITITGPATVTVTLHRDVDYLFARSLPGTPDATSLTARGSATAVTR